jgi:Na+-driven multidrug efflux pump
MSLYSTRLILSALGQSDFGIFSVVGGVVAMLSFVTNALVITTQRYLSYYHGKRDMQQVSAVFGNSWLLHLLLGIVLVGILCGLGPLITQDFLNIEATRRGAALLVYFAAVAMLFLSFITAPVRALFIARENIIYTRTRACESMGSIYRMYVEINYAVKHKIPVLNISNLQRKC